MIVLFVLCCGLLLFFFFQAEDGIRDLVRSRGLGDVYKRQIIDQPARSPDLPHHIVARVDAKRAGDAADLRSFACLLYTSDAADERSSVDLGGRRIIKKNKYTKTLIDNAT